MINQVLKKIIRATSLAIASITLISTLIAAPNRTDALVKGWTPPEEEYLSLEDQGDNPLGIVIERSKDSQDRDDSTPIKGIELGEYPDLGSDQVFPFVAGLDSYQ